VRKIRARLRKIRARLRRGSSKLHLERSSAPGARRARPARVPGKFFINRVLEILLKTKGGRARGGGWVPLLLTVSTTNVGTVPHPRRDLLQVLY